MSSPSLQEILSRLNINGATTLGGINFPNYLVSTNNSGVIDATLFTSTQSVYQVTTIGGGLGSITSPKTCEIAILDSSSVYVYSLSGWLLISYTGSGVLPFTGAGFSSTNVQAAINELAGKTLLNTGGTITGLVSFTNNPPFSVSNASLVTNLTANYLYVNSVIGSQRGDYFTNASNLVNGTIGSSLLSGAYNISVQSASTAVTANNALHANSATTLDTGLPFNQVTVGGNNALSSTNTTLTIVAGANITLSLNPATNTLTISAS